MASQSQYLTKLIVTSGLSLGVLFACSKEESHDSSDAGTAGSSSTGGATSSTGGTTSTGGSTSSSTGGTRDASSDSSDGNPGTGGAAPTCSYAPATDAGTATGLTGTALVAGTDFATVTEIAAVSLTNGQVLGRHVYTDGDTVPLASGGVGFAIERTVGAVDVLSATGTVDRQILFAPPSDAGPTKTNPHDIVVVPGSSPRKAYVSLYDANKIAVVDLDAGTVTKTIDVSGFLVPGDTDGSVEVDSGIYDPTTARAYFTLERIDQNTIVAPSFHLACPTVRAVIVAIDPATDTLVDLNDAGPGTGVYTLNLVSHGGMVRDPSSAKAYLLAAGCFEGLADGGTRRVFQGLESVDLVTGTVKTVFTTTSPNYLSTLRVLTSTAGLVQSFDTDFNTLWNGMALSTGTLGAQAYCIPDSADVAGPDALIGAVLSGASGDVIDYRVSTGTGSVLTPGVFQTTGLFGVAGVAVVQ